MIAVFTRDTFTRGKLKFLNCTALHFFITRAGRLRVLKCVWFVFICRRCLSRGVEVLIGSRPLITQIKTYLSTFPTCSRGYQYLLLLLSHERSFKSCRNLFLLTFLKLLVVAYAVRMCGRTRWQFFFVRYFRWILFTIALIFINLRKFSHRQ